MRTPVDREPVRSPSCIGVLPATPREQRERAVGRVPGRYVYAAASRTYGAAVWNDARNAADCSAIDAWRESLITGGTVARPAPQQDCAPSATRTSTAGPTPIPPRRGGIGQRTTGRAPS